MRSKKLIIQTIILVLVVIATTGYAVWHFAIEDKSSKVLGNVTAPQLFKDEKTGLSFEYLSPLKATALSDQDKKDKFIARLASNDPAMLVSVKYEDGLRVLTNLSKQELLSMLAANADKSLPNRYRNYASVNEKKYQRGGKDVIEKIFTYTGPNGERAKQSMLIIKLSDDQAIYISAQALEQDFNNIYSQYFEKISSTVNFTDS